MQKMLADFVDKSMTDKSRKSFKAFGVDKDGLFTKKGILKALHIDDEKHAYY
jgi:hypothetical protein